MNNSIYPAMDDIESIVYTRIAYRKQKAITHHTCIICNDGITPGEKYRVHVYKLDGDFNVDKYHVSCFDYA